MKNLRLTAVLGILYLLSAANPLRAQKRASELTLVYDYSIGLEGNEPRQPTGSETATLTVYVKGSKSRSEMTNPMFSSTTFFDAITGSAVILKEVSGQKLLIRLNSDNWAEQNNLYDGLVFTDTTGTKEIAGYKCVKAVGRTRSGATITVYYSRDVILQNKDYDPRFKNLEGLPLEYELTNGNVKIRYRVSKINFNPVPVSKFDIPRTGYREMNYEESKKSNLGG